MFFPLNTSVLRLSLSGSHVSLCFANRSSYPDRKEGEDSEINDEELPADKNLEYDDETLELTLPSGDLTSKYVFRIGK